MTAPSSETWSVVGMIVLVPGFEYPNTATNCPLPTSTTPSALKHTASAGAPPPQTPPRHTLRCAHAFPASQVSPSCFPAQASWGETILRSLKARVCPR